MLRIVRDVLGVLSAESEVIHDGLAVDLRVPLASGAVVCVVVEGKAGDILSKGQPSGQFALRHRIMATKFKNGLKTVLQGDWLALAEGDRPSFLKTLLD